MPKYYRVVEDLEAGDFVELNAEGKVQLHKDGELLGAAKVDVVAGKKLALSDIIKTAAKPLQAIEPVKEMEIVSIHDHDHDGEPDHEEEDCNLVETEVIEGGYVPELQLEEVRFEEPEEKKPWWWRS